MVAQMQAAAAEGMSVEDYSAQQAAQQGEEKKVSLEEQIVMTNLLQRFPDDLARRAGGEAGEAEVLIPKLVDIVDGVAHTDPTAQLKRPDWTYGETPVAISDR